MIFREYVMGSLRSFRLNSSLLLLTASFAIFCSCNAMMDEKDRIGSRLDSADTDSKSDSATNTDMPADSGSTDTGSITQIDTGSDFDTTSATTDSDSDADSSTGTETTDTNTLADTETGTDGKEDTALDTESSSSLSEENECAVGTRDDCYETSSGEVIDGLRPDLDGTGRCHAGEKTCTEEGEWGPCEGAVGPLPRDCSSSQDLNCDGMADNTIDSTCQCVPFESTRPCTGTSGCEGVQYCGEDYLWLTECDAPSVCECEPTAEETCSGGLNNCPGGTKICQDDRTWGPCEGAPEYCECESPGNRNCSAISGALPCGVAECVDGQWNIESCSAPVKWCEDQDDDDYCAPDATCVNNCTAPNATYRENCPLTDCDDTQSAINPTSPLDCTPGTSCVTHVVQYSSTAMSCACVATTTPTHEGETCEEYSICQSGVCSCDAGAACNVECESGTVTCAIGPPACNLTGYASAGTTCGSGGASMCNGSGTCYSNCVADYPKCSVASCVSGSMEFTCTEGDFCFISSYRAAGTSCEATGECTGDSPDCVH